MDSQGGAFPVTPGGPRATVGPAPVPPPPPPPPDPPGLILTPAPKPPPAEVISKLEGVLRHHYHRGSDDHPDPTVTG